MKKSLLLSLMLLSFGTFAKTKIIDGSSFKTTEFLCVQADSLKLLLDDSWIVMNFVKVENEGTEFLATNYYYRVCDIAIPSDAGMKIFVKKLSLPWFYVPAILMVLVLTVVLAIANRKKIDYWSTMRDLSGLFLVVITVFIVLNFLFTCATLLFEYNMPEKWWPAKIALLCVTSAVAAILQILVFKFMKHRIYFQKTG